MKTYDQELLLISKLHIELNESGKLSEATLREYKSFIENNYEIPPGVAKYEIMQPLNVALKTKDFAKINDTIDTLHNVFGGLDKEIYKKVLKVLADSRDLSMDKAEESLEQLKNISTSNIYIDVAIVRVLLLLALMKLDYSNITMYSEKLKTVSPQFEDVLVQIKWSITDVEL